MLGLDERGASAWTSWTSCSTANHPNPTGADRLDGLTRPVPRQVRSALDDLVARGRIGAWGITAVQFPGVLATVFSESPRPQVAQMIANALDAPGDMDWTGEEFDRRAMIRRVRQRGTAVMGIRAVQAGALTDAIDRPLDDDHPAKIDFERAAPLRRLAAEMGESTASLAPPLRPVHRGVDTVVLGVKNNEELAECVAAAERAAQPGGDPGGRQPPGKGLIRTAPRPACADTSGTSSGRRSSGRDRAWPCGPPRPRFRVAVADDQQVLVHRRLRLAVGGEARA